MTRFIRRAILNYRFHRLMAKSKKAEAQALTRGNTQAVSKVRKARKDAVLLLWKAELERLCGVGEL